MGSSSIHHTLKKFIFFGNYHENNSEPQRGVLTYDFETNRWDLLELGSLTHTENMPEGRTSNRNALLRCRPRFDRLPLRCASLSMQAENVNHLWEFDPVGMVGRDKHALQPSDPGNSQEPMAVYDNYNDRYIAQIVSATGNSLGTEGTFSWDPVSNWWIQAAHYPDKGHYVGTFDVNFRITMISDR